MKYLCTNWSPSEDAYPCTRFYGNANITIYTNIDGEQTGTGDIEDGDTDMFCSYHENEARFLTDDEWQSEVEEICAGEEMRWDEFNEQAVPIDDEDEDPPLHNTTTNNSRMDYCQNCHAIKFVVVMPDGGLRCHECSHRFRSRPVRSHGI